MAHPERGPKMHQRRLSCISMLSLLLLTPSLDALIQVSHLPLLHVKPQSQDPKEGTAGCVPTSFCFLRCRISSFPLPHAAAPSQFRNPSLLVRALAGAKAWLGLRRPEFQWWRSSEAARLACLRDMPLGGKDCPLEMSCSPQTVAGTQLNSSDYKPASGIATVNPTL